MNNSMASSGGAGANYALKQAKKEEQEVQSLAFVFFFGFFAISLRLIIFLLVFLYLLLIFVIAIPKFVQNPHLQTCAPCKGSRSNGCGSFYVGG